MPTNPHQPPKEGTLAGITRAATLYARGVICRQEMWNLVADTLAADPERAAIALPAETNAILSQNYFPDVVSKYDPEVVQLFQRWFAGTRT